MTTQNPRLALFSPLLGEWTTDGKHPYLPGRTLCGRVWFERIEDGAFVRMRSTSAEPEEGDLELAYERVTTSGSSRGRGRGRLPTSPAPLRDPHESRWPEWSAPRPRSDAKRERSAA